MHQSISKTYVSSKLYVFRSIHNPYLEQVKEKIFQEETSVCYSHHLLLRGPVWQQWLYIFSWKKILFYVTLLQPLNNYSPSLSKCLDLLCCLKIRIDHQFESKLIRSSYVRMHTVVYAICFICAENNWKKLERLDPGFRWTRFPHIPYYFKSKIKKEPWFLKFEVNQSKVPWILLVPDFQSHTTYIFSYIILFCSFRMFVFGSRLLSKSYYLNHPGVLALYQISVSFLFQGKPCILH